jgi:type II secretory ATPase GspE/PulE/Tfp pilus assembly ATPase PilB-like protein
MAEPLNPYDYGRPVMDQAAFAGRLELLKKVDYTIGLATDDHPIYRHLAITGKRGIGKTSLLNQIAYMGRISGLLAARVELNNELAASQAALFHQILEDVAAKLHEAQRLGGVRGWLQRIFGRTKIEVQLNLFIGQLKTAQKDAVDVPQEALRRSLKDAFRAAKRAGKRAILLCIDEGDLLAKDETVLQALRNAFQQEEGYLIVVAGREDLLANLGKVFGPMQRFFDQVSLGPFENAKEVLDCLQGPLEEQQRAIVTQKFAAEVLEMTGGLPYHVKLLAFHAYHAMQDTGGKRLRLTEDILNEMLDGVRTSETSEDVAERLERRLAKPFDAAETERVTIVREEADETFVSSANDLDDDTTDDSPIVSFVNRVFEEAAARGATQIHFIPEPDRVVVRMRIDGVMTETASAPKAQQSSIASRLKIIANLDIAERRLPQDGVVRLRVRGEEVEGRVQTIPALNGESVVVHLRTTKKQHELLTLGATGLTPDDIKAIESAGLGRPGMIVVAGEAESGKTTTLYSLMSHALSPERLAVSVEARIAGPLAGVSQHQIRPQLGLTTATLIRTVLRQDPDLLLVDPVDSSEAGDELAAAAAAGRSILCSMFAPDALAGVSAYRALSGDNLKVLRAVIAQRLVRRLCDNCKDQAIRGCPACGQTGFRGRVAVFQILKVDDAAREAVRRSRNESELRQELEALGLRPLREIALDKVREGLTTTEEVDRVFR